VQSILSHRDEANEVDVPVLSMDTNTFSVAQALLGAKHNVVGGGIERIEAAVAHFDASANSDALNALLSDVSHRLSATSLCHATWILCCLFFY
jgi:DNA-binding transcriptional regulator YbjK